VAPEAAGKNRTGMLACLILESGFLLVSETLEQTRWLRQLSTTH
jgi:hypothetical protein